MAKRDPFVDHVMELLEPLGTMRARSMFGGFGIFHFDRMIALIADDRLYLKTDSVSRASFEAVGAAPFVYAGKRGKPAVMSYHEAPSACLDDAETMLQWARLAVEAAQRAPAPKRRR
jgi:DNA transformation protein